MDLPPVPTPLQPVVREGDHNNTYSCSIYKVRLMSKVSTDYCLSQAPIYFFLTLLKIGYIQNHFFKDVVILKSELHREREKQRERFFPWLVHS